MSERDQEIGQSLRAMAGALRLIARREDCDYADCPADMPRPCDCPRCLAERALAVATGWRYIGAHPERLQHGQREANIVAAWRALVGDRELSQILGHEGMPPTEQEWFVATTIVQWLATNVGQTVLEGAGYVYSKDTFDRAVRERAREQRERAREQREGTK